MSKKIGLLTAGSDTPGMNAAIRSVGKSLRGAFDAEVIGIQDGFLGLVEDRTISLEGQSLSGILTAGGTILGTSRDTPDDLPDADTPDEMDAAVATYRRHNLDGLVCIGGRETQATALRLAEQGLNVITLPKAIDGDVAETDRTIGFETALEVAVQSMDRLHTTAHSHHRIIIVEMMGRSAGWLTLAAGIAAGADVILIPEIPYDIHKVAEAVNIRQKAGKRFSIIAVSERLVSQEQVAFNERLRRITAGRTRQEERQEVEARLDRIEEKRLDSTFHVSNLLTEHTGLETRITILGYLLRGGAPSASDRLLATQLGSACAEHVAAGHFGVMLAYREGRIQPVPLDQVGSRHRLVPPDHPWLVSARRVGVNVGD
jgi:ATP-dependent phosphofructokinase / diphosphate-dependent phosphofructokinase